MTSFQGSPLALDPGHGDGFDEGLVDAQIMPKNGPGRRRRGDDGRDMRRDGPNYSPQLRHNRQHAPDSSLDGGDDAVRLAPYL